MSTDSAATNPTGLPVTVPPVATPPGEPAPSPYPPNPFAPLAYPLSPAPLNPAPQSPAQQSPARQSQAPQSPAPQSPAPHGDAPPSPDPSSPARTGGAARLIVPVAIGGAVALSLGVYGNLHEGTGIAVNLAGFSSPLTVKVWLASLAFVLAIGQLLSALAMWGKLPGVAHAPAWVGPVHKWSGRLAFLASVPVAIHCLYALGFAAYEPRVLIHSLLGCFFYGVFTVKMLVLSRRGLPGWSLPVFGGLVFTALVGLWLTSSLWFFTTSGVTF